jgi:hypothetical protein
MEGKRASPEGQLSVTTTATTGSSSTLGLALDERCVEGWVEGCLERIGEDDPDEELLFRDLWEDETQRDVVIESLQADCEVRTGRPAGPFEI